MEKYNYKFYIEEMKKKDKKYLKELQLFFDKVDNIKDEELKLQILNQMHICEQQIIRICETIFNEMKKL